MTPIINKGDRVILPGYRKTVKGQFSSSEVVVPTREGVFEKFAESPIRRGANAAIVKDVKELNPILSVEDQVMFDASDVAIPLNSAYLHRLANMLDCAFEHMQHLLDDAEETDESLEAKAFLESAHESGFGGLTIRKEYQKK